MPPSPAFHCTCSSDFSRWWTQLLGWCSHHRGTTTSLHTSLPSALVEGKGANWFQARSPCLQVSMEQHHHTLPMNLASWQTSRLDVACSTSSLSLIVCYMWLSAISNRAFPVTAARVWNSLHQHITSVFCSWLKTYLVKCCYMWLHQSYLLLCLRSDYEYCQKMQN